MRKFIRRTVLWLLFLGVVLFGAAGTLNWPEAWVYLALGAAMSFGGGFWLARHDPALLAERLGSLIQREQKGWDKLLMVVMLTLWVGWLALIGLDAGRYHWSEVPLLAPGRRLRADLPRFLSRLAHAQGQQLRGAGHQDPERARAHCRDGRPLRLCAPPDVCRRSSVHRRRPTPARLVVGSCGRPLLLLVIGTRAVLEERTLETELDGYADYAKRVRYRLVPQLW
jgi:hypothetical protein